MTKKITNPGIRFGDLKSEGEFFLISRSELIKEILGLRERIKELTSGIQIKGWWCACDSFNGEEREKRMECRTCGKPKTVRDLP